MQHTSHVTFDTNSRERLRFAYREALATMTPGEQNRTVIDFEGKVFVVSYLKHFIDYLDEKLPAASKWSAPKPLTCDIGGDVIVDEFYDSRVATGTMWAIMCPKCFKLFGPQVCGTGNAQHYRRSDDGSYIKIEG